jgi:hypothetical protein
MNTQTKSVVEQANEVYEELNGMWAQVHERIASTGCLKPFAASEDKNLVVEKHGGKWTVMYDDGKTQTPIMDCSLDKRILYLSEVPFLFSSLSESNSCALVDLTRRVSKAKQLFNKFMDQI